MGPQNPSLGDTLAAVGTATLVGAIIWVVLGIPLLVVVVVVKLGAGPIALGALFVWLTVRIVNGQALGCDVSRCLGFTLTVGGSKLSR